MRKYHLMSGGPADIPHAPRNIRDDEDIAFIFPHGLPGLWRYQQNHLRADCPPNSSFVRNRQLLTPWFSSMERAELGGSELRRPIWLYAIWKGWFAGDGSWPVAPAWGDVRRQLQVLWVLYDAFSEWDIPHEAFPVDWPKNLSMAKIIAAAGPPLFPEVGIPETAETPITVEGAVPEMRAADIYAAAATFCGVTASSFPAAAAGWTRTS